jgi:hypothetical protein
VVTSSESDLAVVPIWVSIRTMSHSKPASGAIVLLGLLLASPLSAAEIKNPSDTRSVQQAPLKLRSVQQRLKRGDGRKLIKWQLNNIVLDEVLFDNLTLEEVVNYLRDEAKRLDPLKLGINFMYLGPASAPAILAGGGAGGANGGIGQPVAAGLDDGLAAANPLGIAVGPNLPAAPGQAIDLPSVIINVAQPLLNMKMIHVLDVVAKTADQPINISINDYAVVIMPRAPGTGSIYGRGLRTAPTAFREGMSNVTLRSAPSIGGRGGTGSGGN